MNTEAEVKAEVRTKMRNSVTKPRRFGRLMAIGLTGLTSLAGLAGLMSSAVSLVAQPSNPSIIPVVAPPASCSAPLPMWITISSGIVYACQSGVPTALGSGGSGTVSGQAANTIPLGTSATVIGNQSHITEVGGQDVFSQPLVANQINRVYDYCSYTGMHCDGTTDDTTAFNNLLAAVYAAGGGKIVGTPGKTSLITGQITFPNSGGAGVPTQGAIYFDGGGSTANGNWAPLTASGFTINDTYNAPVAKIITLGSGMLDWSHTNFIDTGTDCAPFFLTTNTTLHVHDNAFSGTAAGASACNDGVILGGTTTTIGGDAVDAFQGYGTVAERNFSDKMRMGVYGRVYANGVKVLNNTFSTTCGGDATHAAIQFDGTTGFSNGNTISGNLIEMTNYVQGISMINATGAGSGNTFYDPGAGSLYAVFLSGAAGFTCNQCLLPGNPASGFTNTNASTLFAGSTQGGAYYGFTYQSNAAPVTIKPEPKPAAETTTMLQIARSSTDPTSPNAIDFSVSYGGNMTLTSRTGDPTFIIGGTSSNVTYDQNSITLNTGNLNLYPGTTTTNNVVIGRGELGLSNFTTSGRPSVSGFTGKIYYDSTEKSIGMANGSTYDFLAKTLSLPTGSPTYTPGTNVTSVGCATGYTCTNVRGEITIVGGTATTGTIATVNFSGTLSAAPFCTIRLNGGTTTYLDLSHGTPSTSSFTIAAGVSVTGLTFNVDYVCQP